MNERQKKIMVPYEEKTDTCPDCSNIPCDCGLPAGYTPTPRTNARWEKLCCSDQSWYQIAEEIKLDCRQLESELTALYKLAVDGELKSSVDYCWVSEDEMDAAWNMGNEALQTLNQTTRDI